MKKINVGLIVYKFMGKAKVKHIACSYEETMNNTGQTLSEYGNLISSLVNSPHGKRSPWSVPWRRRGCGALKERKGVRMKTAMALSCWVLLLLSFWCWALPVAAAAAPRKPAIYGDLDPDFTKTVRAAGFEIGSGSLDWATLSKFNVWVIKDWNAGGYPPELIEKFLNAGGGIYLAFWSMDSAPVLHEWDPVTGPLGITLERAQTVDRTNEYTNPLVPQHTYALTTAIADSPVSKDIKAIWYPDHTLNRQGRLVTTLNMKLSPDWQVIAKGMPSSAAYLLAADGAPDYTRPLQKEPPLFAIRPFGEGRVAAQSFPGFYTLGGGYTRMVNGIVMTRGDGKTPSDAQQLILNCFQWLAAPSLATGKLGGWKPGSLEPQKPWPGPPVTYDRWETMRPNFASRAIQEILLKSGPSEWETFRASLRSRAFRGLLGVHSQLSSGTGTVEENVKAAVVAGYDFVVFAENLERMTSEKYDQLVAECKRLTTTKTLVLPGMEVNVLRDNYPFHYLIYDFEKFPDKHYLTADGKAMNESFDNWYYQVNPAVCAIAPHVLYTTNSHPWFLRFFNGFALVTYKSGQTLDEAIDDFLYLEENAAFLIPSVVHLTYSPVEVNAASKAPFQMYCNATPDGLGSLPPLLKYGPGHAGGFRSPQATFVSSGPMLTQWNVVNRYTYHLGHNDRVRLNVAVESAKDLSEVLFYDGPRLYRRYQADGKRFAVSVEEYHSRYWHFIMEARNADGGRLIASNITTMADMAWCKTCTDQQNLIWKEGLYFKGQWALIRIPASLPTDIRWWAGAGDDGPRDPWNPMGYPALLTQPGAGADPMNAAASHIAEFHGELSGPHMDVVRANYRWMGAPQRHDGPDEELDASLQIWTFRPPQPHSADSDRFYASSPKPRISQVLMEADYLVKKDLLPLATNTPNLTMLAVQDYLPNTAFAITMTPSDGGSARVQEVPLDRPLRVTAQLPKNGYFALYPISRGSLAVVAPDEGLTVEFQSDVVRPGTRRWYLVIGRQLPEAPVVAGTVLTTRCILVKSQEGRSSEEFTADLAGWLQDAGFAGAPYYQIKAQRGNVESTQGWLRAAADGGTFVASIRNAQAAHEVVPIAVSGLNDLWDAVYLNPSQRWRRHITVQGGVGYTSLDQTAKDERMFIGHTLVCDRPDLMLRLLDSTDAWCRFQVHNSSTVTVTTVVVPGTGICDFLSMPDFTRSVKVPAGATVTVDIGTRPPAQPYVKVWDCFDLQYPTGSRIPADHGAKATHVLVARPGEEKPGYLMCEAWSSDEPAGPMTATFRLKIAAKDLTKTAATISVWNRSADRVLVLRTLKGTDFSKAENYQDFVLEFERPEQDSMDYRIQWPGEVSVTVDTITVREKSTTKDTL